MVSISYTNFISAFLLLVMATHAQGKSIKSKGHRQRKRNNVRRNLKKGKDGFFQLGHAKGHGSCLLSVNCHPGEFCDFGRCVKGHGRESAFRSGPGRRRVACFHESSLVGLPDGTSKPINEIQAGEKVVSVNEDGKEVSVDVVYVPHLQNSFEASFLLLTCTDRDSKSTMFVTPDHFVFRSSANSSFGEAVAVRADELTVGDWLWRMEDSTTSSETGVSPCQMVEEVSEVKDLEGVYTLFTENGRFIVNNLVVSSYAASWLDYYGHDLAHQAMFLHRIAHSLGQSSSAWFRYVNDKMLEPLIVV